MIFYSKNKKQLPLLIQKYNMYSQPFGEIGTQYVGDGIIIIVDKKDMRIDIYDSKIEKDVIDLIK